VIGQTVGHYRVLDRLGSGGMGEVFLAEDVRLGRSVALKFLPGASAETAERRERFLREARAASRLDHPNICAVYEIDETAEGRTYIAMAHCDGETLRQVVDRGPVAPARAVEIALQVAEGLAEAHRSGVVHRDIKPANLMVLRDGRVKILDFGLAKLRGGEDLTSPGMAVGTAAYMSPEQTTGGPSGWSSTRCSRERARSTESILRPWPGRS
jgi:serine/threonine-protein kinase